MAVLQTTRLTLSPCRPDDRADFIDLELDPQVMRFLNGGHAVDNGYFPAKDAILIETVAEGSDNPYVNILVARTADKDNPLYQRILEVYHTDEVAEIFATAYKGAYLPAWK